MESRDIDELLSDLGDEKAPTLSAGFAPTVLRQARLVKAALVRHRRWLVISSLIAMGMAVLISSRVGDRTELSPPPFDAALPPVFSGPAPTP